MKLSDLHHIASLAPETETMPVLFVGHGSPMNAIEENTTTAAWAKLGEDLPTPRAILSISAHWYTQGTFVHTSNTPRTIYDFYGFPEELYEISYPAKGSPDFAQETSQLLGKTTVTKDTHWGLDHGTWSVLVHMYPKHQIPVFQLSIDYTKPAKWHYELASELQSLRKKGVLIMGSGNIVHNLGRVNFSPNAKTYDWAMQADNVMTAHILEGNHKGLIDYQQLGEAAALAVPTPDHYLPLLYTLALQQEDDKVSFPVEGFTHGSISMRAVLLSST